MDACGPRGRLQGACCDRQPLTALACASSHPTNQINLPACHQQIALVDALYRKSLRVAAAAKAEAGAGKIVNL